MYFGPLVLTDKALCHPRLSGHQHPTHSPNQPHSDNMPQGHSIFAVTCPTFNFASRYTLPAVLRPSSTHKQGFVPPKTQWP